MNGGSFYSKQHHIKDYAFLLAFYQELLEFLLRRRDGYACLVRLDFSSLRWKQPVVSTLSVYRNIHILEENNQMVKRS
jgi:hypothetical protein